MEQADRGHLRKGETLTDAAIRGPGHFGMLAELEGTGATSAAQ